MLQFNNDIISGEVSQSVQTDIFADFHWIIIFSSGKAWINSEGRTEEPKSGIFFTLFGAQSPDVFRGNLSIIKVLIGDKKKYGLRVGV